MRKKKKERKADYDYFLKPDEETNTTVFHYFSLPLTSHWVLLLKAFMFIVSRC